ncbi:MAG: ABC transporter ATP-binding protein [Reyranellaceae bacterium]
MTAPADISPSATAAEPVVSFENVERHFAAGGGWFAARDRNAVKAVDGISFELLGGETLALVGESGCGKTTVGRMLVNVDRPTRGTIRYRGRDLAELGRVEARRLRRHVQMVFQDPFSSLNPRMTVAQTIAEPLLLHGLADRRSLQRKVEQTLASVGLSPDRAGSFPHQFSGGQRQRIGIARALAVNPDVIVCDEPVSALDVSIRAQIVNLLQDLQQQRGISLLFISHDLGVVRHIADRIAVMYLGRIVEIAGTAALFDSPRHPYTRALLAAVPVPDPARPRQRAVLEGELPSPLNVPAGCRFHPRCPYAVEECRRRDPELRDAGPGAAVACHRWEEIGHLTPDAPLQASGPLPTFERRLALYRSMQKAKTDA